LKTTPILPQLSKHSIPTCPLGNFKNRHSLISHTLPNHTRLHSFHLSQTHIALIPPHHPSKPTNSSNNAIPPFTYTSKLFNQTHHFTFSTSKSPCTTFSLQNMLQIPLIETPPNFVHPPLQNHTTNHPSPNHLHTSPSSSPFLKSLQAFHHPRTCLLQPTPLIPPPSHTLYKANLSPNDHTNAKNTTQPHPQSPHHKHLSTFNPPLTLPPSSLNDIPLLIRTFLREPTYKLIKSHLSSCITQLSTIAQTPIEYQQYTQPTPNTHTINYYIPRHNS